MLYIFCDSKINYSTTEFKECSKVSDLILKREFSELTEEVNKITKIDKISLFIHTGNSNFKSEIVNITNILVKKVNKIFIYFISTSKEPYKDIKIMSEINEIILKCEIKSIPGFIPEIYLKKECWEKIISNGIFDEKIFFGFDRILEAKLKLLHLLLTKEGAGNTNEIDKYKKQLLECSEKIDLNKIGIDIKWDIKDGENNIVNAINKFDTIDNCFDQKYIEILSGIRDKLLAKYDI
jgi:hypothetical protein